MFDIDLPLTYWRVHIYYSTHTRCHNSKTIHVLDCSYSSRLYVYPIANSQFRSLYLLIISSRNKKNKSTRPVCINGVRWKLENNELQISKCSLVLCQNGHSSCVKMLTGPVSKCSLVLCHNGHSYCVKMLTRHVSKCSLALCQNAHSSCAKRYLSGY